MLSKLPPRERQIVDILYERGSLAVAEICDALPVQLSGPGDAEAPRGQGLCSTQRFGSRLSLQPRRFGNCRQEIRTQRYREDLLQRVARKRRQRVARNVRSPEGR